MTLDFSKVDPTKLKKSDDVLTSTLSEAVKIDPDQQVNIHNLADESGVPEFAVADNPTEVEQSLRFDRIDVDKLAQDYPGTAEALRDHRRASVAHDDVSALQRVEDTVRAIPSGFIQQFGMAFEGVGRTIESGGRLLERGVKTALPDSIEQRLPGDITGDGYKYTPAGFMRYMGGGYKQSADDVAGFKGTPATGDTPATKGRDTIATDIAAGVGQVSGQILTTILAPNTGLASLFAQGVDQQGERQEKSGTEGDSVTSDLAMLAGGAITATTEKLGIDALLSRVPPKIRNDLLRNVTDLVIAGGAEAVQEVSENVLQGVLEKYTTNPDADIFKGLTREAIAAGGTGAIVRGIINLATPGRTRTAIETTGEQQVLQNASVEAEQSSLDQLNELASESKLRQRDAETFAEFVQLQDGDNNTHVFIDGVQLALYLQTVKESPATEVLSERLQEAQALNADVSIPIAAFASKVAGTEHYTALRDHMTLQPETVSSFRQETAQAETQRYVQNLINDAQQNVSEYVEAQQIYEDVKAQLIDTGTVNAANAGVMAQIVPAWATVYAKRNGMTVAEVYEKSDLSIIGPQTGKRADLESGEVSFFQGEIPSDLTGSESVEYQQAVNKGLDMSTEARLQRARDMGFDTNAVYYHGTGADFDAFDPDRAIGTQFWSTTDKASIERGEVGAQGNGVIKELYAKVEKPAGWDEYDKFGIDELIGRGYDSVKLEEGDHDTLIVFNPSQYRSVNAAFDPDAADSAQLLAQSSDKSDRGYFSPANSTIRLTEASDLSTFLHEFAHFMFEMERSVEGDTFTDINNWFKRNASDVAREASVYFDQESSDRLQQNLNVTPRSITERDSDVKTGEPVSFRFAHNTESATKMFGKPDKDSPFGRGYEPSGRYVTVVDDKFKPYTDTMVTGELTLVNPLVVDLNEWKQKLSEQYGGKTGKKLSKVVIADGYDGIITVDGNYLSEVVDFTTFDETKALYQKAQQDKDLIIAHNLSVDNLLAAEELGGLAAPSLAVIKDGVSDFDGYGEISLLMKPEFITDRKARAFDADVYSPRQPRPEYDINEKKFNTFLSDVKNSTDQVPELRMPYIVDLERDGVSDLQRSEAMRFHYLTTQGKAPKIKKVKVPAEHRKAVNRTKKEGVTSYFDLAALPWFKDAYIERAETAISQAKVKNETLAGRVRLAFFNEDGSPDERQVEHFAREVVNLSRDNVDYHALRDDIAKKFRVKKTEQEYNAFVAEKFNDVVDKKRLFKGFNERTGDRRYSDYTLQNVVREMTRELQGGEGSVRSAFANEMRTVSQVQQRRNQILNAEDFQKIKDESNDKLEDALEQLKPYYKFDSESWGYMNDASQAIAEGRRGVLEAFENDPEVHEIVSDLTEYLSSLPTEYFEIKAQRAVEFSEFDTAVVPKGVDQRAVKVLRDAGVKVKYYSDDKPRKDVIGEQEKLLFQRDINVPGVDGSITEQDVINYIDNKTTGDDAKDGAIYRATHEQFARGFETYLMEGKSPSIELRNAFRTFARWLTEIYRRIRGQLNVNVDNEMRQVFDRMLATEEQIAAAEARKQVEPLFTDAAIAGMTEEQFSDYQQRQATSRDKASETLRDKLIKEITRTTKAWWKEEKRDVFDGEFAALEKEQVYRAIEGLRRGEVKLDRLTTREMVGEDITDKRGQTSRRVPAKLRGMTVTGGEGIHPDEAAAFYGYNSGSEMLTEIIAAENIRVVADQRAEDEMKRRHGDILNDGTIEREADEAISNEEHGDVLLSELKTLSRNTPAAVLEKQAIKSIAEENIAKLPFNQIHPGKYRKAEIRAAQESTSLLATGDTEGAALAKSRQVMNYYLGMAATEAKAETMKIVDRMNRYNKKAVREEIMKAGEGYWSQIERILSRFELRKAATLTSVDQVNQDINTWARDRIENHGDALVLTPEVMNELYKEHWKKVPHDVLRGVNDSVKNIEHVARYSNKIKRGEDERDFQQVVTEWVDHMNNVAEDRFTPQRTTVTEGRNFGRWAMAQMTKIPYMTSWLDGNERVGLSHDLLMTPVNEAYNNELNLWADIGNPVMRAIAERSKEDIKRHNRKIFIPEIKDANNDGNLMGHQVLAVALNTGNQGNLRKMLAGENWGNPDNDADMVFENPKLQAVLQHMSKSDWDLVQLIWDQMELLYPQLADVHRRTTGLTPPKVAATPINTAYGRYGGGYYPVKYDPERDFRAEKNEDRMNAQVDSMFGGELSLHASVTAGATNERTGYYAPVRLSLDVVPNHFQETIHYITHHDAVREINKLLNNKEVAKTIKAKLGTEEYKQLKPWLNDIAKDGRESNTKVWWESALRRLRFGTTLGVMGFKASTGIIQILGTSNAAAEVGISNLMQSYKMILGRPEDIKQAWQFATENSKVMTHRAQTMDREIKNAMQVLENKRGFMAAVQETSMKHIMYIQTYMVDLPTWYAAYIKGMKDFEGDEQRAFDYADWSVENVQGSGSTKDLAQILRTQNEGSRMFTMFMTFFSALWNQERDIVKGARSGAYSTTTIAAKMMFLFIAPVILESLLRGDLTDDDVEDEEKLQKLLLQTSLYPIQSVPFVRDVANGALGEYGYNISPIAQLLQNGIPAATEVVTRGFTDEEITKSQVKNASKLVGAGAGIPGVNQAWATGEHLYDILEEGEEFSLRDFLYGPRPD